MPGFLPRLAIGGDVGLQFLERPEPYRDKDRMPELCDSRERVGAVGGDADLRPRLLIGPRRSLHIFCTVLMALVGIRLSVHCDLEVYECFRDGTRLWLTSVDMWC